MGLEELRYDWPELGGMKEITWGCFPPDDCGFPWMRRLQYWANDPGMFYS
jgi:hypothetical protein